MDCIIKSLIILTSVIQSNCVSLRRQLAHIARTQAESKGYLQIDQQLPSRRSFYEYDPREVSNIIGLPSRPSHLPEAEPIHPGHTLIRPALGMLKSAVKFPHKELEDGAGVYGNYENLGIRYDSKNERVLYSGFRRSPSDYIMIMPGKPKEKNKVQVASAVLDPEKKNFLSSIASLLKKSRNNIHNRNTKILIASLYKDEPQNTNKKKSYYLNTRDALVKYFHKLRFTYPKFVLRGNTKKQMNNIKTNSNFIEEDSLEQETSPKPIDLKDEKPDKKKWTLSSYNSYDHININDSAPELGDLIPSSSEESKARNWWFYNQNDLVPFLKNKLLRSKYE
ncbi:uncharacterized protein LOC126979453 isoform X2 [Leptidea sinapis]|uniref:uncharacterized protein LOC126979453 isoform X2 n=1 Tax=Leptidea sinapis TaxID=189913 RepID=UPI00213D2D99|nr:uncharacterized protein LOC126979453 isoform X2 [Leptidea sinapis]